MVAVRLAACAAYAGLRCVACARPLFSPHTKFICRHFSKSSFHFTSLIQLHVKIKRIQTERDRRNRQGGWINRRGCRGCGSRQGGVG